MGRESLPGKRHLFQRESNLPSVAYTATKLYLNVPLVHAVLASCSAPTFFDPTKVQEYLLADGGLWANNPSLAAVIDAQRRLNIDIQNIKILSLGTGQARTSYGVEQNKKWGLMQGWKGPEFISFMMSLQAQSTHNYLQLLLRPDQMLRIDFESDLPLPLDDVSAIDDLISRADREFTHNSEKIRTFLNLPEGGAHEQ
jgi:predicted acylesterase/phospholipase RssA